MAGAFDLVPDYEADKGGTEQSLFIRIVDLFKRLRPEPDEIEVLLKIRMSILNRSVFWLQDKDLLELCSRLGAEVSRWDLARSACRDLTAENDSQRQLCGTLRYCPTCLQRGWHSAMFQHWALPICPVHGDRLRTGCPACREEIITNLIVMARAQMTCDHCGFVFERSFTDAGHKSQDHLPASAFVAHRRALPQQFEYGEETDRRLLTTSDARTSADLRGRALQRFQVWPEHFLNGYRNWPTVVCEYERTGLEPQSVELSIVEDQVLATLLDVKAILRDANCMQDCPTALRNRSSTGARLDGSIPIVAAAYWKTARIFRLAAYLASNCLGAAPRLAHFGYACFASSEAWRESLRFEVIGLMALTVLELRRCRFLIEVDWERHVPTEVFLPAWRLFQWQTKFELEIRPRVSAATLRRLIHRYAHRRLLEVPKDQALLAKLVELDAKSVDADSESRRGCDTQAP